MKKVLVTGGAGFVGSHLCRRLLRDRCRIFCMDKGESRHRGNISKLIKDNYFTYINHDVTSPILSNIEFEQIYNLACPASPIHYQNTPVDIIRTSIYGAFHVLDLAKKCNATVLQASTSEVYGAPDMHPQTEDYWGRVNPIGERGCYEESKRCTEALFHSYFKQYGTDVRIVRIFNTYGPGMSPSDGRVVSSLILQALKGEDIHVYGDGSQTRSFQHVDDLVEGMVRMMNNTQKFIGPVNIGNPGEYTILELAEMILRLTKESKSKIVFKEVLKDDPQQRKPDISLAKEKLGWEPKIPLEEGLKKTIEYFQSVVYMQGKKSAHLVKKKI
ncbi:MAG: SDR family oxidoreductase [Candidatus Moranbacteria bacterium]|nr:SDR family oxidoreductase [Candidatus Moranbacteria bacterium]